MSSDKFSWENIDGSEVTVDEIEASFRKVMDKAREAEKAYAEESGRRRTRLVRRICACAAAAVVLMMIPVGIHLYNSSQETALMAMQEADAQRGEILSITLPDGSLVTLNAGSTLKYPEEFGKERVVELSGEAFFEVVSSERNPFIVKTSDICVTAHGTSFNVSAYPEDRMAGATLCTGCISVEHSGSQKAGLKPGQTYILDRTTGAATVRQASAEDLTAWKDGHICIISQPVDKVFRMMERKFDVNIHLTTDRYEKAVLTAKFINGESLDEMLSAVCHLVPGMEYSKEGKDIYIR